MSTRSATRKDAERVSANSGGVDTEEGHQHAPQHPIPHARALPAIAWNRCRRIHRCSVRGCLPPRSADGPRLLGTASACTTGRVALAELLDLRWYGGFDPLGYSVLSPPVMALLGVRLTTALAYVASVVLLAALLKRTAVRRPVAGAIVGAVCLTGNLVVTRTTFALGLA